MGYTSNYDSRRTILPEERRVVGKAFIAALLTCGIALGQSALAPTPAKPLAFDVVSIRPDPHLGLDRPHLLPAPLIAGP
jgi:hypothetical protein